MPYAIRASNSDTRAVSMEFDPAITMDFMRKLVGVFPITEEDRTKIPERLIVGRPREGGLPHILGWSAGPWIVSQRVHAIVEELEPSVQEFRPIELFERVGKKKLENYFLLLPPPKLDAVIKEKTDFDGGDLIKLNGECALNGDVIKGHHFWRGQEPLHMMYFCSDVFFNRLKSEKLDGWIPRCRCTAK